MYCYFFPLSGGTYVLDINIPDSYPFNPPKVRLCVCERVFTVLCACGVCVRERVFTVLCACGVCVRECSLCCVHVECVTVILQ